MTSQDAPMRLSAYANEFPYAGINRANAAPKTFAALRRLLRACELEDDAPSSPVRPGSYLTTTEVRTYISDELGADTSPVVDESVVDEVHEFLKGHEALPRDSLAKLLAARFTITRREV